MTLAFPPLFFLWSPRFFAFTLHVINVLFLSSISAVQKDRNSENKGHSQEKFCWQHLIVTAKCLFFSPAQGHFQDLLLIYVNYRKIPPDIQHTFFFE